MNTTRRAPGRLGPVKLGFIYAVPGDRGGEADTQRHGSNLGLEPLPALPAVSQPWNLHPQIWPPGSDLRLISYFP